MERRKFIKGSILAGLSLLIPLPKAKATSLVPGSDYLDVPVSPSSVPQFASITLGVDNLDGFHLYDKYPELAKEVIP